MKATIETVTVHHVTSNTDGCEGRGATISIGWFFDRVLAERAGKGKYVMGTDCPIETKTCKIARIDDGSVFLLGPEINVTLELPEDIRKRAIAKLTPAERAALGLT